MDKARNEFLHAQQSMLERYGVDAESTFVDAPSVRGRAHVLTTGSGCPVVMVNGIGTPAAMWAPLMAKLTGFKLFAIDLPGFGLTDTTSRIADELRSSAVKFLDEVLEGLDLTATAFVSSSMGALWVSWLALEHPHRVKAMVHVGCPAVILDSSAPLPMRLLSIRAVGRLLTRIQPPSPEQVERLGRMVNEFPLPPELARLLLATERLPGFRSTFLAVIHALLGPLAARPSSSLTAEQLADIGQAVLLIWGKDDPFGSPDVGARAAAAMPHARLRVVDGGHAPWLKDTCRVGRLANDFLAAAV